MVYRVLVLILLWASPVMAQDRTIPTPQAHHSSEGHPPSDLELHEQFYSKWMRPDLPTSSCCNMRDCYPTEITYQDGKLYARRREDGKLVLIPENKIDQVNTSPDGRNHVCMPSPNYYVPYGGGDRMSLMTSDTVYCFVFGSGT